MPSGSGYTGSVTFASGTGGSLTLGLGTTPPSGDPTLAARLRRPQTVGASALVYAFLSAAQTVTFTSYPGFSFTLPSSVATSGQSFYLALYDPTQPGTGYTAGVEGPGTVSGSTVTFTGPAKAFTLVGGAGTYAFALYAVAAASPTPGPTVSASPTPTPSASATATATATSGGTGGGSSGGTTTGGGSSSFSQSAFTCPSQDSTTSVAQSAPDTSEAVRRRPSGGARNAPAAAGLLAVTYDRATATRSASALAQREQSLGTTLVRSYDFPHAGLVTHLLAVPPAQVDAVAAALRAQAGVRSVAASGGRRFVATVTQPYFTNDPYFNGFQTTVAPSGHATAPPATYHVAPYEESAGVPGQWDMHAIKLEYAFGYSQASNGSGITNAAALGSSSVKVAIIDTGQDTGHPELHGKIVYQKCFITNPNGQQSTSNFTTDPDGHGTDVAGIAASASNNALGFTGTGGNVSLYGYRVFPTPDTNCTNENTTDPQCSGNTADVASAIEDAISQGVNVISMSLGGGGCTGGVDSDPVEGNAVADAIAANVIVVAAAGNDGSSPLEAPACDSGVIAVGATSLADGQTNGTGRATGSASSPSEYVASYSDYGSPGANAKSSSAWGIVAPGGDPSNDTDSDDLHWVENLWTSTPYSSNDAGSCTPDYPGSSGTTDCRTLIAGTSMATPHVAGAAALILSVNSAYQSPTRMKQLLCTTADDISDSREGCGRLNVYRAMATALGDPSLP